MITLAVEDRLSEAVANRLLADYAPDMPVTGTEGLNGFGQLKAKLPSFNMIARYREPVLIITDLDNPASCPVALIQEWRQNQVFEPGLLFRVAVMEIEAWLIADRSRLAQWLGIEDRLVPRNPEHITQPKESLVALARRSPKRALREAIVPRRNGTRTTGPGYNDHVSDFATRHWNPEMARRSAPSLDRAIARIGELAAQQPA